MTDLVTVTLPREQWEAVVKAIDLGLKGFKPAEQVLGKYKDKMNVTDAEIIKVQEGIIKDYAEELERLKKCVEEIENNRHIKELSDEEILEAAKKEDLHIPENPDWNNRLIDFANAILKKASEK